MFRDYDLVTASCHPSSLSCPPLEETCSPTSGMRQHSPAPTLRHKISLDHLSQRFDELSPFDESSQPGFSPIGSRTPSRRRTRRQAGVRMLCDPAHLQNIHDMVERLAQAERGTEDDNDDDEHTIETQTWRRHGSSSSISSTSTTSSDTPRKQTAEPLNRVSKEGRSRHKRQISKTSR